MFKPENRQPDFRNLAAVLECQCPQRPTLFEFFMNNRLYGKLLEDVPKADKASPFERMVLAFESAGYDHASVPASGFHFPTGERASLRSHSLDEGAVIFDRESFDRYRKQLVPPEEYPMTDLERSADFVPKGMKLMVYGPNGVLENVTGLVGYSNLCMMLYDDEQLVHDIFELVGTNLLRYYTRALEFDTVGMLMSNDDWGFNTQTMLSPDAMRRFVFPWHKQFVSLAHSKGCYAVLHSCGKYDEIIDDVIYDMQFDGRHSYEDAIVPVETAYDSLQGKIAVLGGMDIDFMVRKSPEEITARAKAMFARSQTAGGYALGTGNSVPEYVPDEHFFAMIRAAF